MAVNNKQSVDSKVANIKTRIESARKKLSAPNTSAAEKQILLDKIADYNRQIEQLTKRERRVVPVQNAPIYMNRSTGTRRNTGGANRVSVSAL